MTHAAPLSSASAAPKAGATPVAEFGLSDSAARRIAELAAMDGREGLLLRVVISGGGCSGFQYKFDLDNVVNNDDLVFERDGAKVVVDSTSLQLVRGGELDYVEDMMGAFFALKNPNATSTCGCGASFSL